jgi:hypothetical protein
LGAVILHNGFPRHFTTAFKEATMSYVTLELTVEEQEVLVDLLQDSLKRTLVEEHRTRAPEYRQRIIQREDAIKQMLEKLGAAVA